MVFDGAASEPVNAAELSCVKSPATASERQAVTISLRMPLCAHRSRSFFAPDPAEDGDHERESRHADEKSAHLAGVGVEQDVTGDRHAERDAADLSVETNRPWVAARIRIAFRAIRESARSLEDVDYSVGDEPAIDIRIGERDHVAHSNVLRRDGAIEREAADRDGGLHRAGIDGHRLVAEDRERNVCGGEGDGGPREEAHRHLARRLEETQHRWSYACVADQVNVVLADRP